MKTIKACDLHKELRRVKGRPRYRVAPKAERTVYGHVFASKAEAEFYRELLVHKSAALAEGYSFVIVLQPRFLLAGVLYTADFMTLEWMYLGDATRIGVYEVKGKYAGRFRAEALRRFRRDARQMKQIHGLEVELVER